MKKMAKGGLLFVLCGLLLLLGGVGNAHAQSLAQGTIQVQNTGYTDAKGTMTVSASCPLQYTVQSGNAQITSYEQGQVPVYAIQFNGPDAQASKWTTTVENKNSGSLNVTVTVTCTPIHPK